MAFTRIDLENKIKEIYEIDNITPLIDLQIGKLVRERKLTYLDIARAIAYFHVIQENPVDVSRGIGIVPYVIDEANRFFTNEAKRLQEQLEESEKYKQTKELIIVCKTPKRPKREVPFIDISTIKGDDNE